MPPMHALEPWVVIVPVLEETVLVEETGEIHLAAELPVCAPWILSVFDGRCIVHSQLVCTRFVAPRRAT